MLPTIRVAFRQHLRQPGFALTVILTLALTIGATTAVFSVFNGVLVRALPYASPDRLVWIASVRPDNPNAPFSLPEFMDYRSQTRTLSGLAGYANWTASVAGDGMTERFQGARMSANAFEVLGVSPAAGRLLNDSDDSADAPAVAVVSYRLWQRQYGGRTDVIGTTARINGASFEIVGVLPAQFPLPLRDIDVIIPLTPDRDPVRHVRNSVNFLRVFGRLESGTSADQAQAELQAICRSLREQFPVEYARKEAVRVDAFHEVLVGDFRQSMLILLGAVIVVLGTALANLVSLALVRANNRRAELTIRTAVGASRVQLARQLAAEALLLAAVGSLLGIVVATHAVSVATMWAPPSIPRLAEVSIDRMVALFVTAMTVLVTALLTGPPLASIARTRAGDALRLSSRGAIGDRWNHRIRAAMVVGEIATALVLLLSTGVLVQHVLRLQELHLGFNPDGVFQARVSIPPTYRSPDDLGRFYDRLSERLTGAPGVAQLGVISVAPLSGLLATAPFSVAGQSTAPRDRPNANVRAISPGYLSTVETKVLQGRSFAESDRSNTPPVALVSAALADRFLAGAAVGHQLLINDNNTGPRPVEIVGVVENVRHIGLDEPPALDIYLPLPQVHQDFLSRVRENQYWMVRTASDPTAFRATFLAHLRAVNPDAAVADPGGMRQLLDAWLGPRRFNLGLFGSFALTAVLLAIVGLYGLVSYTVSQRSAEIGLRLAIGATQGDVQRMILRQAARLGVAGAIGGMALALSARPLIGRVVTDVRMDPAMVLITVVLLLGIVLLAAWLPARRAARIEPTSALRTQ